MFGVLGAIDSRKWGAVPSMWFFAGRFQAFRPGGDFRLNINPATLFGLVLADAGVNYSVPTFDSSVLAFETGVDVAAVIFDGDYSRVLGPYLGVTALWNSDDGGIGRVTVRVHALANDIESTVFSIGVGTAW